MIRILTYKDAQSLIQRKTVRLEEAERIVAPILADVRERGDAALLDYARKFDRFTGDSVRLHVTGSLEPEFLRAVEAAANNIRDYARAQLPQEWFIDYPDGRRLGQVVRPLDAMGAYVPAGRYPLPSTVLMTVIPAQVAGVATTCIACPHPSEEILGIAHWLGVTHMFQMGGAQAIAAFAYGTETVPKVDRIVGPGNIYVAAAKKLIAGETGIDFVAGPTEIVIIAAEGDPRWIAADLLAQADSRRPWREKWRRNWKLCPRRVWPSRRSIATAPSSWSIRSIRPWSSQTLSRPNIWPCMTELCWPTFATRVPYSWAR